MAVDHIRYDLLAQQALRGVVRNVLTDAAKNGLPGEHHFYISINTRAPGVRLPPRLHEQYPEEMTIILQHQFWDLRVNNEGFEVGLSFGGIPERLGVPFEAIKGFFDPSVQFGLQFEIETEAAAEESEKEQAPGPAVLPVGREPTPTPKTPATADSTAGASEADTETPATGGAEVVRLDRFRKK